MEDGRNTRRAANVARCLDIAARRVSYGERVTHEIVAREAELAARSVYRYWPTHSALIAEAGALVVERLRLGTLPPNEHQSIVRSPMVAAAILVAARDEGLDPSKTFRQIDNAARLCGQTTED